MKLEQLYDLNDDELSMLWFMINKVNPPSLPYEADPCLFVYINHQRLVDRIKQCGQFVKDEHQHIFNGLKAKIGIE
jgi:hypothetical protein